MNVSPWVEAAAAAEVKATADAEWKAELEAVAKVEAEARAYTRPLLSSTEAVLVTPPRVPLSNGLGGNHAPDVSNKMCSR